MTKTEAIIEANALISKMTDRIPVVCQVRKNSRLTDRYVVRFHRPEVAMNEVTDESDSRYTMVPVHVGQFA